MMCSCSQLPEGYTQKDNVIYKLHQIGEQKKIANISDYITIDFTYSTISDSIFFKNSRKLQIKTPEYPGAIDECFLTMSIGDSVSFLIDPVNFFDITLKTDLPSFLKNQKYLKLSVKLVDIQTNKDFEEQKRSFLSWISDFGEYEKVFLQQFLDQNKIEVQPTSSGLYKLTLSQGEGTRPRYGDTVTINYDGKFLNGVFFDSTRKRESSFEFILGREWQVIEGIEEAISLMTEGEQALVIIPSRLAFGDGGSSTGLIPPYTSVIYELNLVRVAEGDSLKTDTNVLAE